MSNILTIIMNHKGCCDITIRGTSMEPVLHDGETHTLTKQEQYSIGDILVYEYKNEGLLAHRLLKIENNRYFCKGDNSFRLEDISEEQIIGKITADDPNNTPEFIEASYRIGVYQDSVVFVDDSDYELGLVSTVLPALKTVKADDGFIDEITALFDNLPNESDIDRTAQFKEQKEREKVHVHTNSAVEYNDTLETVVICRKAEESDVPRMAELSQRANRFNINGKRYTDDELSTMLHDDKYGLYILKASDKYGDMRLVAMAVVNGCDIESFMLSCRVFGRDFEVMLLNEMKKDINAPLHGKHIPTGKNDYCKDFFIENSVIS